MKRRGPHVRFSTPAQDAASAPGFAPNGVSIFTRTAASGDRPAHVNDSPRDEPRPHVHLLAHQLIARNDRQLSKIQKRLLVETDPERRKKLLRDREIKSRFLSRLYAQQMKGKRHERQAH